MRLKFELGPKVSLQKTIFWTTRRPPFAYSQNTWPNKQMRCKSVNYTFQFKFNQNDDSFKLQWYWFTCFWPFSPLFPRLPKHLPFKSIWFVISEKNHKNFVDLFLRFQFNRIIQSHRFATNHQLTFGGEVFDGKLTKKKK